MEIGREDAKQFQRRILSIVSSMKETPQAKIDKVAKEIEETGSGILDLVGLGIRGDHRKPMQMPPCLTHKREMDQNPVLCKNTHTEEISLKEVKWIRDINGKVLGFYQQIGPKTHLVSVSGKLLGWFNPLIGDDGMTFDRTGKAIGFGNQLSLLLS